MAVVGWVYGIIGVASIEREEMKNKMLHSFGF
jgi:hypothetical protein